MAFQSSVVPLGYIIIILNNNNVHNYEIGDRQVQNSWNDRFPLNNQIRYGNYFLTKYTNVMGQAKENNSQNDYFKDLRIIDLQFNRQSRVKTCWCHQNTILQY